MFANYSILCVSVQKHVPQGAVRDLKWVSACPIATICTVQKYTWKYHMGEITGTLLYKEIANNMRQAK